MTSDRYIYVPLLLERLFEYFINNFTYFIPENIKSSFYEKNSKTYIHCVQPVTGYHSSRVQKNIAYIYLTGLGRNIIKYRNLKVYASLAACGDKCLQSEIFCDWSFSSVNIDSANTCAG